ncbi:MAG: flavodoxin family protein [Clostridia bacterium]|nr:flavodoxin family protein [Clostridia bacterium]
MKALLINGSPHARGCTFSALEEVAKELNKCGVDSEILQIGVKPISGCIVCGQCRKNDGHCVIKDDGVNEAIDKIKAADAVVLGSPVYYAGVSGQMKSCLDRVFFAGGGNFAQKLGAAVVSCRRGGSVSTFDTLNHYFTICNMPVVPSQYWNSVHGAMPGEAKQDVEGLQTMRTLGYNMAWLLKCIELGKADGIVPFSESEKQITNFIR